MTGQVWYDSDGDVGIDVAVGLVNGLVVAPAGDGYSTLAELLTVDPPSQRRIRRSEVDGFVDLARRSHEVVVLLTAGELDGAAHRINALLARHSAQPHLAEEGGRWRLHHHPADAGLLPMWTAIVADAFARLVDADRSHRLGTCPAPGCGRAFLDRSRNGSRRFCSLACQNRVKAAAFRARRS